MYYQQLLEQMF